MRVADIAEASIKTGVVVAVRIVEAAAEEPRAVHRACVVHEACPIAEGSVSTNRVTVVTRPYRQIAEPDVTHSVSLFAKD